MKILITGANGFLASDVIDTLVRERIFSVSDIYVTSSKKHEFLNTIVTPDYQLKRADFIENNIDRIDYVLLIGGFTPQLRDLNDLDLSFNTVQSNIELLMSLPNIPKKIIYISSISIYSKTNILKESSKIGPTSPYGWSKLIGEHVVEMYCQHNKINYQILRIGGIYGKGDNKFRLIPVTLRRLLENSSPIVIGHKFNELSLMNVHDVSSNILKSIFIDEYLGPINVVSERKYTVEEVVSMCVKISGTNLPIEYRSKKKKITSINIDNSKFKRYLGIESIELEKGISEHYEYLKSKYQVI